MFLSHDSSHFERLGGTRRDAAVNLRKQRFKRCRAGRGAAWSYEWATRRRHHLPDGSERTCRVSVRVRATRREARKRACACVPQSIEHRPASACASAARTTSGPACVASLAPACARAGGGGAARRHEDVARCTGGGKVMVEAGACLAPRAGVACACQCGPYLEEVGAALVAATAAVAAAAATVAAIATDGRGDVRFQPFAATVAAARIATAGIATSGSGVGSVVGSALGSGDGGDVGSGVASVVGTARGSAYGSVVGSGVGSAIGGDDREGGCAVRWRQRSRLRGSVGSACAVRCLCARLSLAVVARLRASVRCGRGGNADAHHQH